MMKRFISILVAIPVIAMCFSSCDSNDNDSEASSHLLESGTEFVGSTTIKSSTSSDSDASSSYVQDPATYKVDLDDDTLTLTLEKAQMSSAMPVQVDIVIPSISYTKIGDVYTFSGEDIVPTYLGKPFAQYAISSFSGNIKLMEDDTFQLTVNMIMGTFDVSILANSVN